ncbi:hypothetical protein [Streptomyces eurythermus]|uniref:hypothetical protein n=1 Tax=Streptomyces eurythermus TaxID=42237 RepID=UPI0036D22F4F
MEHLQRRGVQASLAQLERWRHAGILPRNRRTFLGRGNGSASTLDGASFDIAEAMSMVSRRGVSIHEAVLRIFTVDPRHNDLFVLPGFPLPEPSVRSALEWFVERGDQILDGRIRRALQKCRPIDDSAEIITRISVEHYNRMRRNPDPASTHRPSLWSLGGRRDAVDLAAFGVASFLGDEEIGTDRLAEIVANFAGRQTKLNETEIRKGYARIKRALNAVELDGKQAFQVPRMRTTEAIIDQLGHTQFDLICDTRDKIAFVAEMGHLYLQIGGSDIAEPMASRILEASTGSITANMIFHSVVPIATTLDQNAWHYLTAVLVMTLTESDGEYLDALNKLACAAAPDRFGDGRPVQP